MRRKPSIPWLLSLLLLVTSGTARGGDAPPGEEVPWPVAKPGARAIFRTTLALDGTDRTGRGELRTELKLTIDHAQDVLAGATATALDVRVTQGRMWGELKGTGADKTEVVPIVQDIAERSDALRSAVAVAVLGASVVRHVETGVTPGFSPAAGPADPRSKQVAITDLALPIPGPAPTVRVGTPWDGPAALATHTGYFAFPVRHAVAGVAADSITVRSEGSFDVQVASARTTFHAQLRGERRYARGDGLLLDGSLEYSVTRGEGSSVDGTWRVRFERATPSVPPAAVAAAERAMADLASGDAPARRAAAAALSSSWPHGARAVPLLVAALADDDAGVRDAAAAAIERLGVRATEAVVASARGLDARDSDELGWFVSVSDALGAAVTPTDLSLGVLSGPVWGTLAAGLIRARGNDREQETLPLAMLPLLDRATYRFAAGMEIWDPRCVEMASAGLALLGMSRLPLSPTRAVPKDVMALLRHADPLVRWVAVCTLDRFGSQDPAVLAALKGPWPPKGDGVPSPAGPVRAGLRADSKFEADVSARDSTFFRLSGLPWAGPEASAEEVTAALKADGPGTRWEKASVLARAGAGSAAAVPALVERLKAKGTADELWVDVVRALGRIGAAARPAVALLDPYVARAREGSETRHPQLSEIVAAEAASRIDGPTSDRVAVLVDALAAPGPRGSPLVSDDTGQALDSTVSTLLDLAGGMDVATRARSVEALSGALARSDVARSSGTRIVRGLARLGPLAAEAVPGLVGALWNATKQFDAGLPGSSPGSPRDLAAESKALGAALGVPWALRYAIVDALGSIGPKNAEAIAALEPLTKSDDLVLRYLALRSLRLVRGT